MISKLRQLGQGMTEYIIIVALIAIAAIAVYGFFGDAIRGQVGAMTQELAGQEGQTGTVTSAAGSATGEQGKQGNLATYGQ
jgi:type IV pilus assembly protein PilA